MKKHNIDLNKSDIRVIDQGSYKYNTTIRANVVDRDVAIMIPINIKDNPDPRKIKGYLKESISRSSRVVDVKEPCVRATYLDHGKEWLHIDLPLYAVDGKSIKMIAEEDNISISACKKRLSRSKEKMRELIAKQKE